MGANIGDKFGRLTITSIYRVSKPAKYGKQRYTYASCICECGNSKEVFIGNLTQGFVKSCGCLRKEVITKHGLHGHKLYMVHNSIRERCNNPNHDGYYNYGGRGIKMHPDWVSNPKEFIDYCVDNGWREGLTIDRINNDLGYAPGNLRFVSNLAQCSNMRKNVNVTIDGVTKCVSSWARFYGLTRNTLKWRLAKCSPDNYAKCLYNLNTSQS